MWEILNDQSFVVGATLVAIYQAAKFAELNLADPITNRYVSLLPGAKVRDFASSGAYHAALLAFIGASLIVYFLLCQISPDVFKGAAKLLSAGEPPASLKGIPYPLYIAALFVGLTQPVIPIFSQLINAQRDFFHDRINVPRRVIDLSEALTHAIESRSGSDKRLLADEVRNLASGNFVTELQGYGDAAYYSLQLEKLELDDEDKLGRALKGTSARELRVMIERLILCALVAVMRRSGPNALIKIAEALHAPVPPAPPDNVRYFAAGFISSGVLFTLALAILANLFGLLFGPVSKLFPNQTQPMWPMNIEYVTQELCYIVPPIFISLLGAVLLLVPREPTQAPASGLRRESSLGVEFVDFFRSSAVVLGMCIVITMLIQIGMTFYEYGSEPTASIWTPSKLILPMIQGFIPVAVCLFTTWYLVSSGAHPQRRGLSFTTTLFAIVAATALVGFFYELTFVKDYVQEHPKAAPGWDHVLFGVVANVLVSVCAFASIALFFTVRAVLPEAARSQRERSEEEPAREREREREPRQPRREIPNPYRRVNAHNGASQHAGR